MSTQRRNVSATLVFDMPLTKGYSVLRALVPEDQIELNDMAGQSEFIWLHSGVSEFLGYGVNFEDGQQDRGFKFSSGRDSLLSKHERARCTAQIISSTSGSSLDAILDQIDTQSTKVNGTTVSHGPFGVFRLEHQTKTEIEEPGFVTSGNRKERPEFAESRDPDDLDLPFNVDEYPEFDLDPRLWEDDQTLLGGGQEDFFNIFLQESDELSNDQPTADEHPSSSILSIPTTFATDFSDLDMKSIAHLLDRYRNSLITSFLPVRKYYTSPWEFIHVPKVYEALGEAMISGETTHAKMGLFFAVLGAMEAARGRVQITSQEKTSAIFSEFTIGYAS
ncbi:hypothetical protein ZTR_10155 [Talaromyces verruculosus]|nr:hypothetical protein ZTR_10155 [Talaromyces verruculosus]